MKCEGAGVVAPDAEDGAQEAGLVHQGIPIPALLAAAPAPTPRECSTTLRQGAKPQETALQVMETFEAVGIAPDSGHVGANAGNAFSDGMQQPEYAVIRQDQPSPRVQLRTTVDSVLVRAEIEPDIVSPQDKSASRPRTASPGAKSP